MLGDRGVEQDALTGPGDGERFGIGHTLEHFDVDLALDSARTSDFEGPRKMKEIVTGDADAYGVGVLGTQCCVDQSCVTGVDVGLGPIGRGAPTVEFGLGRLHRQVGAFDQSHLDGATRALVSGL